MIYALDKGNNKILAQRGFYGRCPQCGDELIPKCGEINAHHWSHTTNTSCDAKEETAWHIAWKSFFKPEFVEVKVGNRRADVCFDNIVLEFQKSSISVEEIKDRELDYRSNGFDVYWIVDASDFGDRFGYYKPKFGNIGITYKYPKKILHFMTNCILDRNGILLQIVNKKRYYRNMFVRHITLKEFYFHNMKILKEKTFYGFDSNYKDKKYYSYFLENFLEKYK